MTVDEMTAVMLRSVTVRRYPDPMEELRQMAICYLAKECALPEPAPA